MTVNITNHSASCILLGPALFAISLYSVASHERCDYGVIQNSRPGTLNASAKEMPTNYMLGECWL